MLDSPTKCPKCSSNLIEDEEDLVCPVCSSSKISSEEIDSIKFAMTDYKIYVDLDGVLVDFDKGFKKLGHGDPEKFYKTHGDKAFWSVIRSKPHFFLKLDWLSDGKKLWNYVKKLNPIILTKIGPVPNCSQDKKSWVATNIGKDIQVITTTKKDKYADDKSILIDDDVNNSNLGPWEEAGGIGIKHVSTEKTIKELKKILKGKRENKLSEYKLFTGIKNLDSLLRTVTSGVSRQSLNIPISDELVSILDDLKDHGAKGLVVGGAVRDAILGVPSKDVDIEVYGMDYDTLIKLLEPYGKTNLVGKSFGVVKFTDSLGETYDFSLPRRDSKMEGDPAQLSAVKGRGFDITIDQAITPKEAASRRDFTMNSLAYDPLTDELHDYFGGVSDLQNGILRATSPAFSEDPLRVLRGMQFAGRFGMQIEPKTAEMASELKDQPLVRERVSEEWMKLLTKGKFPSKIIQYLIDTKWIDNYPELKAIINLKQDSKHHPEGTVDIHTGLTMDAAAVIADESGITGDSRAVLILGAMCHDLGKATTTGTKMEIGEEGEEEERVTSYGHHEESARLAEQFLYRLGIKHSIVSQVVPLVQHHMDHLWFDPNSKSMNVRQIAEKLYPATIEQLVYIIRSDMAGRPPLPGDLPDSAQLMVDIAKQEGVFQGTVEDLLTGKDLLSISPLIQGGKLIGEILKNIREEQLKGIIKSKDDALNKAHKILRSKLALIRGEDILAAGIPEGPEIKKILKDAWEAQLAGEFSDKAKATEWLLKYLYSKQTQQIQQEQVEPEIKQEQEPEQEAEPEQKKESSYDINKEISSLLRQLGRHSDNVWKSTAYTRAAESVQNLNTPIDQIDNLKDIEGIGSDISNEIAEYLSTGKIKKLEKLESKSIKEHPYTADEVLNKTKEFWNAAKKIGLTFELTGSVRRKEEHVGDLDGIIPEDEIEDWTRLAEKYDHFQGKGKQQLDFTINGISINLRSAKPDEWESTVLFFTGPRSHTIFMRQKAQEKGYKLNRHGLFDKNGKLITTKEKEIFKELDIPYLKPEER